MINEMTQKEAITDHSSSTKSQQNSNNKDNKAETQQKTFYICLEQPRKNK